MRTVLLTSAFLSVGVFNAARALPFAGVDRSLSDLTLVADGCGGGMHRDVNGVCVFNGPGWGGGGHYYSGSGPGWHGGWHNGSHWNSHYSWHTHSGWHNSGHHGGWHGGGHHGGGHHGGGHHGGGHHGGGHRR
jgi:hypothetical protein